MKRIYFIQLIIVTLIFVGINAYSQSEGETQNATALKKISTILDRFSLNGYIESYYAYDFNTNQIKYGNQRILSATCPFNNEFRLNIIKLLLKYSDDNFRANLAIQYGDIPFLLKSPDKEYLGMISQGYFGIKILDKLWLDFGFMGNPIGIESTETSKNLLTSVSVGGYCQPDNILGAKISWNISDALTTSLQIYNTYGIINTHQLNKYLGISIAYSPNESISMGYNNAFTNFGMEGESNYFQMYNNIYFIWNLFNKFDLNGQLDYAFQTNSKLSDTTATAFITSGFIGVRYRFLPKFSISVRGEFFYDPDGIISRGIVGSNEDLKTFGLSVGIQYSPFKKFFFRGEYQYLRSEKEIFYYCKNYRNSILFSTALEL